MSEQEQRRIFAKNLNRLIEQSGKLQSEVAKDLGFYPTTFNTWCKGKIIPSMGKIQAIADYFHVGKTELLEEQPTNGEEYYHDAETAHLAQEAFEQQRMLLDATRDLPPEDMAVLIRMAQALRNENGQ